MKALVQRGDSLIKPRQSQNRMSGFSTDSVLKARFNQRISPLNQSLHDISIYYLLSKALESRVMLQLQQSKSAPDDRPVNSLCAAGRLPVLISFSRSPGIKISSVACFNCYEVMEYFPDSNIWQEIVIM